MIPAEPTCPHCRYDLTGIALEHESIVCPECGRTFDPGNPFGLQPWPHPVRIALVMSLPTAAMFLVTMGLGTMAWHASIASIAQLEHIVDPVARSFLLLAWTIWPGVVAQHYVRRCAHPGERWIVWTLLALSGIGLNALVMLGIAFVGLIG
jgi:hypothetical protein